MIAANNTVEEICAYIEADSLAYLSLDGLLEACHGGKAISYCTACYTGNYPTEWVDVDEILPATGRNLEARISADKPLRNNQITLFCLSS